MGEILLPLSGMELTQVSLCWISLVRKATIQLIHIFYFSMAEMVAEI